MNLTREETQILERCNFFGPHCRMTLLLGYLSSWPTWSPPFLHEQAQAGASFRASGHKPPKFLILFYS